MKTSSDHYPISLIQDIRNLFRLDGLNVEGYDTQLPFSQPNYSRHIGASYRSGSVPGWCSSNDSLPMPPSFRGSNPTPRSNIETTGAGRTHEFLVTGEGQQIHAQLIGVHRADSCGLSSVEQESDSHLPDYLPHLRYGHYRAGDIGGVSHNY